ncbi:MAG TPA: hypothetical protein VM840_08660 [Actinomycetota bacterium]|nr:hypothetical protein [Actinomycetota bacterium]
MNERTERVAELLHEASELHHAVYRMVDGDDPDWASWYASWLIELSELPEILGSRPVRSELIHELVELGRGQDAEGRRWEDRYAERIVERFGSRTG